MANNTGNPIGSTAAKDLSDNAENLDHLSLSDDYEYLDRLGRPRKTLKWMEDAALAIPAIDAAMRSEQQAERSEIEAQRSNAARVEAEAARDTFNLNVGRKADIAEGLRDTVSGQSFTVLAPDALGFIIEYKNNSGAALEMKRYPSALAVQEISDSLSEIKTIGLSSAPVTGSYLTQNTRVFDKAVTKTGIAQKLRTFSKNTGQVIALRRYTSNGGSTLAIGDTLTQIGSDYLVPLDSADSAKEISINFPVNAGEFIGIYGTSFSYPALTSGIGAVMGQGAAAGNFSTLSIAGFGSGYRWQVGLDIASSYVNAARVAELEASVETLGALAPIAVTDIADLPPSPAGRMGVVTGARMGMVWSDGAVWRWVADNAVLPITWMRILDLAKRDGWMSVYDLNNQAALSLVESGGVEYVSGVMDALGNSPAALQFSQATRPVLARDGNGGLASARFSGAQNLLISDAAIVDQPYCILAVSKFTGPLDQASSTGKFAFSGRGANRPSIIGYDNAGTMTAWHGNGVAGNSLANSPTVFGAVFDGPDTTAYQDGWLTGVGAVTDSNKMQLGYIGADYQGARGWTGDISTLLVYKGDPGAEKVKRMQLLLADVFGIPVPGLEISALGATVTRLSDMKVLYAKNADTAGHVASITKVMTCLVLDRRVTDLSQTLTVVPGDIVDSASNIFVKAGDVVSYLDLMHSALLPSDNNAATAIARGVGYLINPGAADDAAAKASFYAEMNVVGASLNMASTVFNNAYEGTTSTASDLTKMLAHIRANAPRMLSAGRQGSHVMVVTGANPRTYTIASTVYPNFYPGYAFGKTGTGNSFGSLVVLWDKDGERYASVIIRSFPAGLRFREARWLMDEAVVTLP